MLERLYRLVDCMVVRTQHNSTPYETKMAKSHMPAHSTFHTASTNRSHTHLPAREAMVPYNTFPAASTNHGHTQTRALSQPAVITHTAQPIASRSHSHTLLCSRSIPAPHSHHTRFTPASHYSLHTHNTPPHTHTHTHTHKPFHTTDLAGSTSLSRAKRLAWPPRPGRAQRTKAAE